jgi:hypothetical protein
MIDGALDAVDAQFGLGDSEQVDDRESAGGDGEASNGLENQLVNPEGMGSSNVKNFLGQLVQQQEPVPHQLKSDWHWRGSLMNQQSQDLIVESMELDYKSDQCKVRLCAKVKKNGAWEKWEYEIHGKSSGSKLNRYKFDQKTRNYVCEERQSEVSINNSEKMGSHDATETLGIFCVTNCSPCWVNLPMTKLQAHTNESRDFYCTVNENIMVGYMLADHADHQQAKTDSLVLFGEYVGESMIKGVFVDGCQAGGVFMAIKRQLNGPV